MKNQIIFLTACTAVLLSSCASLSSYTDAKTQEKGTVRSFFGGGQTVGPEALITEMSETLINETSEALINQTPEHSKATGTVGLYIIEAGARVGISENIDAGFKFTLPEGIALDGRYMLTNPESDYILSTGLKGSHTSLQTESSSDEPSTAYWFADVTLPFYVSYYPTEWLAVTVIPDFTYRLSSLGGDENKMLLGGNVNAKIGSSAGIIGEFGFHEDLGGGEPFTQYGVILFWTLSLKDLSGNPTP